MNRLVWFQVFLVAFSMDACLQSNAGQVKPTIQDTSPGWWVDEKGDTIRTVTKTDAEWKAALSQSAYSVLRDKGTEIAYSGEYYDNHQHGLYKCAGCGLPLFSSETKFDSGTGWPSFYAPIDRTHVLEVQDNSHYMSRTEVLCHRCGGHLGHVFDDGPKPTGLRYCMNSISLSFDPAKQN